MKDYHDFVELCCQIKHVKASKYYDLVADNIAVENKV